MSDGRPDRLREQRNRAKEKAREGESKPSEPSQPSERSKTDQTGKSDEPSVKDEHEGVYIYLPPGQKDELGFVFNAAKATYEREHGQFEKNRHFYPLVVEYGLERVDGADADELAEMLDELDY